MKSTIFDKYMSSNSKFASVGRVYYSSFKWQNEIRITYFSFLGAIFMVSFISDEGFYKKYRNSRSVIILFHSSFCFLFSFVGKYPHTYFVSDKNNESVFSLNFYIIGIPILVRKHTQFVLLTRYSLPKL